MKKQVPYFVTKKLRNKPKQKTLILFKMTPEEKANELIGEFKKWQTPRLSSAVPSAIITVKEIIKVIEGDKRFMLDWEKEELNYWNEVLTHLKNKS